MNSHFSIYDAQGRVVRVGHCPESMLALQVQADELLIAGQLDYKTEYVATVNGVPERRQRPASLVTKAGSVLSNLQPGALININGKQYIAEDSQVRLNFNHTGTYVIVVTDFPYLDATFTEEVT